MAVKNLTGQQFGFLKVVERDEDHISISGKKRIKWKCVCQYNNCGNTTSVLASNLQQGNIISCGCYKKNVTDFKKQYNTYDLSSDYGIGYTSQGKEFFFDKEDYQIIKDYCWYENDQGYLLARIGNKSIRMHRIILNAPDGYEVDHIHGKETRNDNRKSNLRLATHCQNNWNKDKPVTNTSGYRGVSWDKNKMKWFSQITYNKEHIILGYFNNIEEAYQARLDAENKYYGEFSYENSINTI